jgi:hypothetical protein
MQLYIEELSKKKERIIKNKKQNKKFTFSEAFTVE